ncbi:MAG: hypothetical protein ACE14S_06965 [Candidatus Bathyarchaeia archaeon]
MNVLTKLYWLRVLFGAIAGVITALLPFAFQSGSGVSVVEIVSGSNTLINGITIALLIYMVSYYLMKAKYGQQVEKQSKIMTMGIFIYFFAWLVVCVLTLSFLIGPITTP